MNAAAAGIRLAQTAYLPRVDGLAQVNRATRNTFYGLLLPQGVIPGVDGVQSEQSRLRLGQRAGSSGHLAAVRFRFARGQRRHRDCGAQPGSGHDEPDTLRRLRRHRGRLSDRGCRPADRRGRPRVGRQLASPSEEHSRAGGRATAAGRGRIESAGRTGGGADAARPGRAGVEVARSTVAQFVGLNPSAGEREPGQADQQLPPERSGAATGDCGKPTRNRAECRDRTGAISTQGDWSERIIRSSSSRASPPRAAPDAETMARVSAA